MQNAEIQIMKNIEERKNLEQVRMNGLEEDFMKGLDHMTDNLKLTVFKEETTTEKFMEFFNSLLDRVTPLKKPLK